MLQGFFNSIFQPSFVGVTHAFNNVRPGLREYLLREHLPIRSNRGIGVEIEARLQEADRLCERLGMRHMRAYHAEKQGHELEAIRLYEGNVADGDLSTLSYERLRAIYLNQGRRRDASRICLAYLRIVDDLAQMESVLPDWLQSNRARFVQYLDELRKP